MRSAKKGFISISVVYTFLILFIFLMLAILASYISRETLLSRLIAQSKEIIYNGLSEEETDPNINVRVYVDGVYSKLFPSYDYYSYDADNSYCTNGASIAFSYTEWSASILNINGRTTCIINFVSGESNIKPTPVDDPENPDDPSNPTDPNDPTNPTNPTNPDPSGGISNIVVNFYADGLYSANVPKKADGYSFDPYATKCNTSAVVSYDNSTEKIDITNITTNTTCDVYFVTGTVTVNQDYVLGGNINLSVYVDNVWSPSFPSKEYYTYNPYKSVCTDNAVLSFDEVNWKISINNITDRTTCKVYFSSSDIEISSSMFNSGNVNLLVYIDGSLSSSVPDPLRYEYDDTTSRCTNGASLYYNSASNNFDVQDVTRNTECFVYFRSR